jgi:hypothetical protein
MTIQEVEATAKKAERSAQTVSPPHFEQLQLPQHRPLELVASVRGGERGVVSRARKMR